MAIIGAGIAGLTSAYELLRAGFDVTVFEAQKRYGGRSLTVRPSDPSYRDWFFANNPFVRRESYCDFVPAEVRGAMVPEQHAHFRPVRRGDGYFELHFNAGPGRIPTSHTAVLHYCREFGVELAPYIFVCDANLLQADDFNGGVPVQIRHFEHDLAGYVAEMLSDASQQDGSTSVRLPAAMREKLRRYLAQFGDLSPGGRFANTPRAGYSIQPGAGDNSGLLRSPLPLKSLLDADSLWPGLLAGNSYDWQLPLLEPAGGMDMIWQAFLARRFDGVELRDHVRLESEVTGMRYADESAARIILSYKTPEGGAEETFDYVIMTGKPFVLGEMDTANLLDSGVRKHLDSVLYFAGGKYGWQARSRFWENDDIGIFGGISWTDHLIAQIWYPSSGYHTPTGVLTGAYVEDRVFLDRNGKAYPAEMDYKVAVDPQDLPPSDLHGSRWANMDHAARTREALVGGEALHPGFTKNVYQESGLSISWNNQPLQYGISVSKMPWARPDAYARLIRAIDRSGRLYMAGDGISYLS